MGKCKTPTSNTLKLFEKEAQQNKKHKSVQSLAMQFIENPTSENFGKVEERLNWGLRGYLYKITGDLEKTMDVFTQTLETVYYKYEQYDPNKGQFSTWVYRIALNHARRYLQNHHKEQDKFVDIDYEDIYDSFLNSDDENINAVEPGYTDEEVDILYDNKTNTYTTYTKEELIDRISKETLNCIEELDPVRRIVMRERFIHNKKLVDISLENNFSLAMTKTGLRNGKIEVAEKIKTRIPELYNIYKEMTVTT